MPCLFLPLVIENLIAFSAWTRVYLDKTEEPEEECPGLALCPSQPEVAHCRRLANAVAMFVGSSDTKEGVWKYVYLAHRKVRSHRDKESVLAQQGSSGTLSMVDQAVMVLCILVSITQMAHPSAEVQGQA